MRHLVIEAVARNVMIAEEIAITVGILAVIVAIVGINAISVRRIDKTYSKGFIAVGFKSQKRGYLKCGFQKHLR